MTYPSQHKAALNSHREPRWRNEPQNTERLLPLKAAHQRLSALKTVLAGDAFRFVSGSLKLPRAGHNLWAMTMHGRNSGILNG